MAAYFEITNWCKNQQITLQQPVLNRTRDYGESSQKIKVIHLVQPRSPNKYTTWSVTVEHPTYSTRILVSHSLICIQDYILMYHIQHMCRPILSVILSLCSIACVGGHSHTQTHTDTQRYLTHISSHCTGNALLSSMACGSLAWHCLCVSVCLVVCMMTVQPPTFCMHGRGRGVWVILVQPAHTHTQVQVL